MVVVADACRHSSINVTLDIDRLLQAEISCKAIPITAQTDTD
jgi:hypothetical protein